MVFDRMRDYNSRSHFSGQSTKSSQVLQVKGPLFFFCSFRISITSSFFIRFFKFYGTLLSRQWTDTWLAFVPCVSDERLQQTSPFDPFIRVVPPLSLVLYFSFLSSFVYHLTSPPLPSLLDCRVLVLTRFLLLSSEKVLSPSFNKKTLDTFNHGFYTFYGTSFSSKTLVYMNSLCL